MIKHVSALALGAFALGLVACTHLGGLPITPSATTAQGPLAGRGAGSTATRSTLAWGVVVDDPKGYPLGGVPVRLFPWKPCRVVVRKPERLSCPAPVASTTTKPNGTFRFTAPSGHYLLTIGSNKNDLGEKRPTVHDNVYLTGGTQHLLAPGICTVTNELHCLPPIPLYTPHPMERNGDYRLARIAPLEQICIRGFDEERTERGLVRAVIDEWLTENVRAVVYRDTSPHSGQTTPSPVDPFGGLTSGQVGISGGSYCGPSVPPQNSLINGAFSLNAKWAANRQTLWFAGLYKQYGWDPKHHRYNQGFGVAEFPIDPRTGFKDPNVVAWP